MAFNPTKDLLDNDEKARRVWKTVQDPRAGGLRLLVCSLRCPDMRNALSRINAIGEDDAGSRFIPLVAEHVLHGWEGMEIKEGKPEPFSHKRAAELFEQYAEIADWTVQCANALPPGTAAVGNCWKAYSGNATLSPTPTRARAFTPFGTL